MAQILKKYQHLVRYAHWAYYDGPEFRSAATDLQGDFRYRSLEIITPFFKHTLRSLTPNTHVHLGVRNQHTIVLAFRGTDFPINVGSLIRPKRWWGFWGNVWTDVAFQMTQIDWLPDQCSPVLVHDGFLTAFNNLCRTQWPEAEITCLTLGSPRVGNTNFCQHFGQSNILTYRVEVMGDPIPTVPDRFTQALPGKLPASHLDWTTDDKRYHHVGIPILLHEEGASILDSIGYGVERPDIEAEETAPPLPAIIRVPYEYGGFLAYWALRSIRMAPDIWNYHDPAKYESTVQSILEQMPPNGNEAS
ncbi:hypothetical protein B0J18DRAFT_460466 [Chaetomium sp. MPI-SDFR-AT-0129]|nr:hypothetical protein B0J18DRAFT_460466 [Chaetomium sp. MPI-SDFR-AT-0129]